MSTTKRQAFERVVSDIISYLHGRNIVDEKLVHELRRQHNINTDRLAANIEKWAMPPHKENKMKAYVTAEIEKTQFLAHKLTAAFANDPVKQKQMQDVLGKIKTMSPEDIDIISKGLTRLCTILLLPAKKLI